jgi:twitching motility protein PilT
MPTIPLDDLLRLVIEEEASDIHLSVGVPPTLRLKGVLTPLNAPPLTAADMEVLARGLANPQQMERVSAEGSVDFGFSFRDRNRFRVSVYRERGTHAAAVRLLPLKLMSLENIGIPPSIRDLLVLPRGLVLVTGPTGSGKTTTLASMLTTINENSARHIITIEDPIEYFIDHKRGIVNQREVGVDVPNFADGLRRALRQDPDVILVGEMRDLETVSLALTAAETGLLVFGTLHTNNARKTVDRMIDVFPSDQQAQVRTMLSASLRGVLAQLLLKRCDGGGRLAVNEILIVNTAVSAIIREGATQKLQDVIVAGKGEGMQFMDDAIWDVMLKGMVSPHEAYMKAIDKGRFKAFLPEEEKELGNSAGAAPEPPKAPGSAAPAAAAPALAK